MSEINRWDFIDLVFKQDWATSYRVEDGMVRVRCKNDTKAEDIESIKKIAIPVSIKFVFFKNL